jgi:hypothetical protein
MGIQRSKSKRDKARKLGRRKADAILNPGLGPNPRGNVVRYAVVNGILYKYFDDGSREAVTRGNHLR